MAPLRAAGDHRNANIEVWLLEPPQTEGTAILDRIAETLAPDERTRADRFVDVRDRVSYVFAHALTRVTLARMAGCTPRELHFDTNAWGKPRVTSPSTAREIGFSIAHTRGLVACAAVRGAEIGVDVEAERVPPLDVAREYFAPPERAAIETASADAQPSLFFALWTLKESVVKAMGTGLSTDLHTFACQTSPPAVLPFGDLAAHTAQWYLWHERVGGSHHVAVAVHGAGAERPPLRLHHMTLAELLVTPRDPMR